MTKEWGGLRAVRDAPNAQNPNVWARQVVNNDGEDGRSGDPGRNQYREYADAGEDGRPGQNARSTTVLVECRDAEHPEASLIVDGAPVPSLAGGDMALVSANGGDGGRGGNGQQGYDGR